jgi:hypothetical protein
MRYDMRRRLLLQARLCPRSESQLHFGRKLSPNQQDFFIKMELKNNLNECFHSHSPDTVTHICLYYQTVTNLDNLFIFSYHFCYVLK